jgi:hypothetical protein
MWSKIASALVFLVLKRCQAVKSGIATLSERMERDDCAGSRGRVVVPGLEVGEYTTIDVRKKMRGKKMTAKMSLIVVRW